MANLLPEIDTEAFRKDYPIIIARNRKNASIMPVVLAYDSDGYEPGQVIARNSVSGLYAKYESGGSSGLDTAVGILYNDVDNMTSGTAEGGQMIVKGEVYEDNCTDLDSDAKTDLNGRSVVSGTGSTIFIF